MNAEEFFAAQLDFRTDVSDVHAALHEGTRFVLVDTRGEAAWAQGHIAQAVPLKELDVEKLDRDVPVVTYCWGPGCNGATKAALRLAGQGVAVKEMQGGIEYWIREGFPVRTAAGLTARPADPLTALDTLGCEC